MANYRDRTFSDRLPFMGDEAEGVFEEVWEIAWERYGFNRPRPPMKEWSDFTKYTPDYIDRHGPIECQGFGRDRVLKIKDEKRSALQEWQKKEPKLRFFIWDTTEQRWACVSWRVVDKLLSTPHLTGAYPEGTTFRGLHSDQLANLKWHDKKRT